MAIIIKPIDQEFKVIISEGKDKLEFFFKQLDYKTKSYITGLTTNVSQGQVMIDSTLVIFYNIKHGLKRVKGLFNPDGTGYKLEFEKEGKALSDKCTDELLATPFSDNLIWVARKLTDACYPKVILHPLTNKPIKGIKVIPADKMKGTKKK